MTNKEAIFKTIQYIEKNLRSEISVMDIASAGCYSLYHFIRLFQNITGISPRRYLLQRRLTEALLQLRDTDKKIMEIAFDFQFGSHEAFTRVFTRYFGIAPSKIRSGYPINTLPLLHAINEEYFYQSEKARNEPPEIVDLEVKILAGISFFIRDDTELLSLAEEWGQFMSEVHAIRDSMVDERFYQVQFWSENQDLGGLYFFIGTEVSSVQNISPQFVIKTIPHGRYLKFIHKGLANKVGYTYRYIYNEFLPDTEYKLSKPFNFEYFGEKCLGPDNELSESEIYIPIEN